MRRWASSCASSSPCSGAAAPAGALGAAEGPIDTPGLDVPGAGAPGATNPRRPDGRGRRIAGRVLLLDEDGRLLLLSGRSTEDPSARGWWFTPGGRAEPGETAEEAARRELEEETGLVLEALGPVVLERRNTFTFEGVAYDQDESFYLAHTRHFEPEAARLTELERRVLVGHRWWTLAELATTDETVYPAGLVAVLGRVVSP